VKQDEALLSGWMAHPEGAILDVIRSFDAQLDYLFGRELYT